MILCLWWAGLSLGAPQLVPPDIWPQLSGVYCLARWIWKCWFIRKWHKNAHSCMPTSWDILYSENVTKPYNASLSSSASWPSMEVKNSLCSPTWLLQPAPKQHPSVILSMRVIIRLQPSAQCHGGSMLIGCRSVPLLTCKQSRIRMTHCSFCQWM